MIDEPGSASKLHMSLNQGLEVAAGAGAVSSTGGRRRCCQAWPAVGGCGVNGGAFPVRWDGQNQDVQLELGWAGAA
jgi:hypothetical protein